VQLGPPGGGFLLKFRGSKDAFFLPYIETDDSPWRTLLANLCRTALGLGASLRDSPSLTSLIGSSSQQQDVPVSTAVVAPPSLPSPASMRQPSSSVGADPRVIAQYMAAAQEQGLSISPEALAEHLAAEQSLNSPPPPPQSQRAPAPPVLAPPPPPSQSRTPTSVRSEQNVDSVVDGLIAQASELRALLDSCRTNGGGDMCPDGTWRLPPREWPSEQQRSGDDTLSRLCASVAASNLTLRRLIAGHLGVSSWRPRPRGVPSVWGAPESTTGGEILSPRVAVWASLCADADELLDSARYPGFVDARGLLNDNAAGEPSSEDDNDDSSDDGDASSRAPNGAAAKPAEGEKKNTQAALEDLFSGLAPPSTVVGGAAAAVEAPPSEASLNTWAIPPPQQAQPPPASTNPFDAPLTQFPVTFPPPPPAPPSSVRRSAECAVCLERQVDTVLLECGHSVACETCANALLHRAHGGVCPLCRAPLSRWVKLYAR